MDIVPALDQHCLQGNINVSSERQTILAHNLCNIEFEHVQFFNLRYD